MKLMICPDYKCKLRDTVSPYYKCKHCPPCVPMSHLPYAEGGIL